MTPPTLPTALAKDQTPAVEATGTVIPLSEPPARNSPLPKINLFTGAESAANSKGTSTNESGVKETTVKSTKVAKRNRHQPLRTSSKKSKKTKVKKPKKPKFSPYVTAPSPLIIRQKYTIEEKYIGKQTSVVDGVRKLKCLHKNLHLKANQSDAYANKIGYLITTAGTELAVKIFVLTGLMSTLLESVDNKLKGGKNVPHPLYVFSRFQPVGSGTMGVCRYAIC